MKKGFHTMLNHYPHREPNVAVAITHTEYSQTHEFRIAADGYVTIAVEPALVEALSDVPAFIGRDLHAAVRLDPHSVRVLKRLLEQYPE
jgi:hypothetical protein